MSVNVHICTSVSRKLVSVLGLLVSLRNLRKYYLVSGSRFLIMKTDEYNTMVNGKSVSFYHNKKNHKMVIIIDYDICNEYIVTLAKGKAIIDFLKQFD